MAKVHLQRFVIKCSVVLLVYTGFVAFGCRSTQDSRHVTACGEPPAYVAGGEMDRCFARMSSEESLIKARRWIAEDLLPTAVTPSKVGEKPVHSGGAVPPGGVSERRVLSLSEISVFLEAGHRAIPELIPLVRDHRWTPWCFHFPRSSGIDLTGMTISKVACYLIEAILRETPYFTTNARLEYPLPVDQEDESGTYAFDRAADAYEAWYARCFDSEAEVVTCPDGDLPSVNWSYDLDAWPKSSVSRRGESCRD